MWCPRLHGHSPGHSFPPPPRPSETRPGGGTTNTGSRVLGLAVLPRGPKGEPRRLGSSHSGCLWGALHSPGEVQGVFSIRRSPAAP